MFRRRLRSFRPTPVPPLLLLCAGLALALPVSAQQVREGALTESDPVFDETDGRVADTYTFEAETGQFVSVSLRSGEFDTFLRVTSPSGVIRENDDSGDGTDSALSFVVDEDGAWTVQVSSYDADGFGAYVVTWSPVVSGAATTRPGRLSRQSPKGQPYDSTTLELGGGEVLLQVTHAGDAWLVLSAIGPDGRRRDAAPDMGSTTLNARGVPAGSWTVFVAGEEGTGAENLPYTLTAVVSEGGAAEALDGRLEVSDPQLPMGEYADLIEVDIPSGSEVFIELASRDFDTFLVVETAGSAPLVRRNDDAEGSLDTSAVSFTAAELEGRGGPWRIWVTSFSPGETGAYVLRIVR